MLNEHTLDQLRSLRLDGMVRAIEEQATSIAAAKTGETRAKLRWKKREGKKRWNARELHALNVLKTHAKFFRLNFMHNPPPQRPPTL